MGPCCLTSESELSSSANVGALRSLFRCTVTWVVLTPFTFACGVKPPFATELSANFLEASGVDTSGKRNKMVVLGS